MSTIDDTTEEFRNRISPHVRDILGMVRRMQLTLTEGAIWQVVGHLMQDSRTLETRQAEAYTGIGFYARPAPGANAEAIVVNVGGAQNPAIIGTRDEDTRKQMAAIAQDEAIAYTTKAAMLISSAGKVLAYAAGQVASAVGLAKASELNNLRAFVMQQFSGAGHVHGVSGASTNSTIPVIVPVVAPSVNYTGTTVLQGQ